jgi:hypothetical protein
MLMGFLLLSPVSRPGSAWAQLLAFVGFGGWNLQPRLREARPSCTEVGEPASPAGGGNGGTASASSLPLRRFCRPSRNRISRAQIFVSTPKGDICTFTYSTFRSARNPSLLSWTASCGKSNLAQGAATSGVGPASVRNPSRRPPQRDRND